ncbi:hypothetical protein C0J52_08152, partial [Blattella germanica]
LLRILQRARSFLRLRHKPIAGDDCLFTPSRSLALNLQSMFSLRTRWTALALQTTMLLVKPPDDSECICGNSPGLSILHN